MHRDRLAEGFLLEREKGFTRHQIEEILIFCVQCKQNARLVMRQTDVCVQ